MARFSLNSTDIALIKRIVILTSACTVVVVAGAWLLNTVLLKNQIAQEERKNDPFHSTDIQPIDIAAHRSLADMYLKNGTPEKAVDHLKRVHALNPRDLRILHDLAYSLLESGNYTKALEYYDYLLEHSPGDTSGPQECARRGIALFYLGKITQSRADLEACLNRFPRNTEALCFLGQIEATKNLSSSKAQSFFRKAIEIDSTYTEAWYQLARYYMELKLYAKARELLLSAVAINPFHSKSYARLGMTYYYLDYPALAKKSYQTALVLNPYDFNTRYNLAELQISSFNDTITALKNYKKALELNPRFYEAAFKTGLICVRNNMYKEAIRFFEQALSVAPDEIRILLQNAAAYEKIDRTDKAVSIYDAILQIDELNPIARQKRKLLAQQQPARR